MDTKTKDVYTVERDEYIKDSFKEEQLYNDINEIKTQIIINKLNHVFEYTNDDESVNNFKNLENEFNEKKRIYDDLVQKMNDEKMIKNKNIIKYYDSLNEAVSDIKDEIGNIPKENITTEKYQAVAEIYKELMVLINDIQRLKNEIVIN